MPDERGLPKTEQEIQHYLHTALPIEDSCLIAMVEPNKKVAQQQFPKQRDIASQASHILSLVWIDIQSQPELADLGRIHQFEGSGEAQFTWTYYRRHKTSSIFLLDVQLRTPVQASFHVPFRVEEWTMLLETIAQHGDIWFVPGPPLDWRPMLRKMGHEAFMQVIEEKCGAGVTFSLDLETMQELGEQVREWKQRFPLLH